MSYHRNTDSEDRNESRVKHHHHDQCPREPGTIIRIYFPPNTAIELGPIRISSPSGICLIVSIPILDNLTGLNLETIAAAIEEAGGTIEIRPES